MDLPSRVDLSEHFLNTFFFLSGGKNDSPEKQNSQKSDVIWRKILEKDFQLFSKIFCQIFFYCDQKWLVLHSFSKFKKKSQMENLGRSCL